MKKFILITFVSLISGFESIGQYNQLNQEVVTEEIFLQTDRDIYITGEDIWFRADYGIHGAYPESALSKSLYIELVTPLGESVNKQKFAIQNGVASGSYEIPEGLLTATYMLRAYTQYQRNFPADHISTNLILVINPSVPLTGYDEKAQWDIRVYADQELDVADRKKSKLAIRIHPNIVKKVKKLEVVDQFGKQVSEVNLHQNGLGLAEILENDSLTYSVKAILSNRDTVYKQIPEWNNHISLQSLIEENALKLNLKVAEKSAGSNFTIGIYDGFLVPHQFREVKANTGWQKIVLNTSIQACDVIYLVLKDADEIVFADAIYRPGSDLQPIEVSSSKKKYDIKSEVSIAFKPTDSLIENYTVSVVKKGTYENQRKLLPDFIISNPQLLPAFIQHRRILHSELSEQIEAVLLIYENMIIADPSILNDTISEAANYYWLPETRGITLRGVVKNINSNKPEAGCDVYVATIGDEPQLHVYRTNQKGEFITTLKHVTGTQNLFLCVDSENESVLEILVNSDFVNNYEAFYTTPTILDTSLRRFIQDLYVNAQIENYKKTEDTFQILQNKYHPIRFPEPSASILLDDYIALPTLREVINEIVPYVKVQRKKDVYSLEVLDPVTNQLYGDPLILVDNLPVFNVNELLNANPELIKRISVINTTYVYGEHMFRGIVFFETNTKNFAGIELPVSSTFLEFQAVKDVAVFIPDDVKTGFIHSKRIADFRNVLYWNHDVKLNDGKGLCEFLTSDYEGSYEVIVRGVNKKGIVAVGTTNFEVRKE